MADAAESRESQASQETHEVEVPDVAESKASGEVGQVYERIRETLGTPMVGEPWRTLAEIPPVLRAAWDQLEPAVDEGFHEGAEAIRAMALRRVREAASPFDGGAVLGGHLEEAAETLRAFLQTHPKDLILVCALHDAWRGTPVGGLRNAVPAERGVAAWHARLKPAGTLLHKDLRDLFGRMREVLGVASLPLAYEALGAWPDFLSQAWTDLRTNFLGTGSWKALLVTIRWTAEQLALALPAEVSLSPQRVRELGVGDEDVERVGTWLTYHRDRLPILIANLSYLQAAMFGGVDRVPAPGVERRHLVEGEDPDEAQPARQDQTGSFETKRTGQTPAQPGVHQTPRGAIEEETGRG